MTAAASLTPGQQQLIRDSFAAVQPLAAPLAKLFYGRLFAYAPAVRPLFKNDIGQQGEKLMSTLAACVDSLGTLDAIRPRLRQLGHRHVAYGTLPEHYSVVAKALLWSLGQALEQRFDASTREAWAALLEEISREMIAGAAEEA